VAIRTVSQWIRSAKQMASGISAEMSHELKVHELHQNLKKAEEQGLENLSPELTDSVQELRDAAASVSRQYEEVSVELKPSSKDTAPQIPTPDPSDDNNSPQK
jgi:sec-independent protein translocase protein TatB